MNNHEIAKQMADRTTKAVSHYWQTRAVQRKKQDKEKANISEVSYLQMEKIGDNEPIQPSACNIG